MARTLTRLSPRIAIGTLLCLTQPAWPACQGRALAAGLTAKDTAKAKQARQLYKQGKYEDAAKIFSDLSSEHPDMLVFTRNLGACYYYLRRPEPALSNLREYLQRGQHVTPDDRSEVERWIAEMEQLRAQTAMPPAVMPPASATSPVTVSPAGAAPPAVPPPQSPAGPSPATAVPVPPPPEATPGPPPTANPPAIAPTASVERSIPSSPGATPVSSGSGLRVAGIACGALGVAAIGTAIYFYTRATSLSDRISSSDTPSAADFKSGKNAETMQWVFYGVGTAALATGSVLYCLGWRRGSA